MAKQSKFNLGKIEKGGRTAMERSIILIGNEAKNFFVNSWRLQGFDDRSVQKWTPRKKQDKKRAGRAILVDSGDLRRSIIREPVNKSQLSVKISTDLVYARVHNEGGIINKSASSSILHFRDVMTNIETGAVTRRFAKNRQTGRRYLRATSAMKVDIGAHSINMPKRQFMGDSYKLNELCKKIIISQLDKIFK
jgi:phage gpG-like protein